MVNRRTKYPATLRLVRRAAREHGYTVVELSGRGKGSHRQHIVVDASGSVVGRFGLTDHPREQSWAVLRTLETTLMPLFGDKWMEQR